MVDNEPADADEAADGLPRAAGGSYCPGEGPYSTNLSGISRQEIGQDDVVAAVTAGNMVLIV